MKSPFLSLLLLCAAPLAAQVATPDQIDEPTIPIQPGQALPTLQPTDDMGAAKAAAARGDAPEALSRYLHVLATHPDDVEALSGAGQAALAIGDFSAASAFFGRAEARAPNNGRVKAGIGSTLVRQGDARGALRYFRQAAALGATEASIAADRGLAYDLRGDSRRAQSEYQLALRSNPADGTTLKRLALSQAISGEEALAMNTLDPLLRKQDLSAWRTRMFARAVAGDVAGANADAALILNAQQAGALTPYLAKLPTLKAPEKAAAVFLGRFPSATKAALASNTPQTTAFANVPLRPPPASAPAAATPPIAALDPPAPAPDPIVTAPPPSATHPITRRERLVEAAEQRKQAAARIAAQNPRRYWAQIAGGANKRDLPKVWTTLKTKHAADLAGRSPWTMHYRYTNRLMIGPFASASAAQDWVDERRGKGFASFMVTTEPGVEVEPLGSRAAEDTPASAAPAKGDKRGHKRGGSTTGQSGKSRHSASSRHVSTLSKKKSGRHKR